MRIANFIAAAAVALIPSAASAQPPSKPAFALPPESITITSAKPSEETIRSFVETRATPTRFLGKMARWRRGICPLTIGLGDKYAKFVTQRIRDVAAAVGAPVNADPGCKPNIEVVFTTAPQPFMDNVRKSGPAFLGYYDSSSQADDMAKVTHPIQAWYTTESLDNNASPQIDTGKCNGTTLNVLSLQTSGGEFQSPDFQGTQGFISLNLSCARVMGWSGSRLGNSFDSGFYNALIVAEPAKLTDYEVGSLADYITMLALSQPASLDSCQDLSSISNMLAKGCASASSKITDGDLAYLQGLYKVPSGYAFSAQRNEMGYEMKKTLVTDKSN
jgi:hypothetical protein